MIGEALLAGFVGLLGNAESQLPAVGVCAQGALSKKAIALLRPVLKYRVAEHSAEFDASGSYRGGESSYGNRFQEHFYALLANQSRGADEALAVLIRYYVGEHPGEELHCEIVHRGKRMLLFLERFRRCIPKTGAEPIPRSLMDIPDFYPELLAAIRGGETCDPAE